MNKYFSIRSSGFYTGELRESYDKAGTWPNDAVEVSDADEISIRAAISKKETISHTLAGWVFKPYMRSDDEFAQDCRKKRDDLLAACDYMAMSDYPLTPSAKGELINYRQALRDVTTQAGFPADPVWPATPSFVK